MSCTHASTCPLFPRLNASLRGWRDAYCDSEAGWQDCARFVRSRRGTSVPLTLLPNGKYAHTIVRQPAGEGGRFASVPATRPADPEAPFEDATEARRPAGPHDHADDWWADADAAFGAEPGGAGVARSATAPVATTPAAATPAATTPAATTPAARPRPAPTRPAPSRQAASRQAAARSGPPAGISAVRTPAVPPSVRRPGAAATRAAALDTRRARSTRPGPDRPPGAAGPSWWTRVVTWLRSPA